jgi:Protein kinase domain
MVSKEGAVKIVDFGIPHIRNKNATRTGQIPGSVSYMAPEQVNARMVDARTDIFSTGVVLYQLFTYTLPFEGASTAATLLNIVHNPPPLLKNFLKVYPPELDAVILKALAKDPAERYLSADDFALDLGQLQGQLKQELIGKYLKDATLLLEKADFYKVKDRLLRVLKIDRQNTQANLLLRQLHQRIQKQEIDEQVRQVGIQAQEAYAEAESVTALGHLERALKLDKNNFELKSVRESIQTAWSEARTLQQTLKGAGSPRREGDSAKQAVKEVMELVHSDAEAKLLHRTIRRDGGESSPQPQVEGYLEQARREIAARNFASALEILKQADSHDPAAPQIRALVESARLGRERERRRGELERINRAVEEALNRDDYRTACERADEGLKCFPKERSLLKFKSLAEKQRQIAERKQFIDDQLANARTLVEQGRSEELLGVLEGALAQTGYEPRLQSLLLLVRENVRRERIERRKADYLHKAKEALRQRSYEHAIHLLEAGRSELKDAPEIEDLLQLAREEAAVEKRRKGADAAAQKAKELMARQEYEQAIQLLETTLREVPDEELRIILVEARRAALDYRKKLESTLGNAQNLLQARKAEEALRLLESRSPLFSRSPEFEKLLHTARLEAERQRNIEQAVTRAQQLLKKEDFSGARQVLEDHRQQHGARLEVQRQLAEITEKESEAAARGVEKAVLDARMLVMANQHQAALDKLAGVSRLLSLVSSALKSAYQTVQLQGSRGLAQQKKLAIERHLTEGEITEAAELLRQALSQFPGNRDLLELENAVREETKRRSEAQQTLTEAQRLLQKSEWKRGGELLRKAFRLAQRAPAVREQVLTALVQAAESALQANWQLSEALLDQLAELQPDYTQPVGLHNQITQRKRQEFVNRCVQETKRLQSAADLEAALQEVVRGLATYRDESRLVELRKEVQEQVRLQAEKAQLERARLEKEAFLQDVSERCRHEDALEGRIRILEEALTKYPQEAQLQQQLSEARELWKRITDIVKQARVLEEAKKYKQAMRQWTILRSIHGQYPGLDHNLGRVTRLHEEALATARSACIRRIQDALFSADYDRVARLLVEAKQEFSTGPELLDLEKKLQQGLKLRIQAQQIIADGHKAVEKGEWEKAAAYLTGARDLAGRDPAVREQVLRELLGACEAALENDWQPAEMLLALATELHPNSHLLLPLRARIGHQKRDQMIERYMTAAVRAQSDGDLQGALRELERALTAYPDERRLLRLKNDIETRLRQLAEARQHCGDAEKERTREVEWQQQSEPERNRDPKRKQHEVARKREQVEREHREAENGRRGEEKECQTRLLGQQEKEEVRQVAHGLAGSEQEKGRRIMEFPPEAEGGTQSSEASATRLLLQEGTVRKESPPPDATPIVPTPVSPSVGRTSAKPPLTIGSSSDASPAHPTSFVSDETAPATVPTVREATESGTPTTPGSRLGWQDDTLGRLEKELAKFIGPIARIIVKKAANRTTDLDELYAILAAGLERESDRHAFLARKGEVNQNRAKSHSAREPSSAAIDVSVELTPTAIDHAAWLLARHVGPLARILAKKVARRAGSLREFYLILAEYLESPTERARFLWDAGFSDS